MTQLNFPTNPVIGQQYTIGTNTWEWNGAAWIKLVPPKNIANVFTVTNVLFVTSSTDANSTSSGSLIVTGGVGIGGNLFVGSSGTFSGDLIPSQDGIYNLGSAENRWNTLYVSSSTIDIGGALITSQDGTIKTANLKITGSIDSSSTDTGSLQVVGGIGIGGNSTFAGITYITNNTTSTSTNTGALIVSGGVGLSQDLYVNGSTNILGITNISNVTASTSTTTGAVIISGGLAVGQNIHVNNSVIADTFEIPYAKISTSKVTINNTATILVDSYLIADYRTAEYTAQISSGIGSTATFQVSKILMTVNNNNTVFATEYGIINTQGPLVTLGAWDADVSGATVVNLYFTPNQATDKSITVVRTAIKV